MRLRSGTVVAVHVIDPDGFRVQRLYAERKNVAFAAG